MRISIIVAVARNGVIGHENKLPWHLPADLKRFRELTWGHPIVMGRLTYESIGKPLPGRRNVVLSRRPNYQPHGCLVAETLEEGLELAGYDDEIFIIGGASVYKEAMHKADRFYLTLIDADIEGDTRFPLYDVNDWVEVKRENHMHGDLRYSFITLDRATATIVMPDRA